jgi:outer membrane protein TolC
LDPSGGIRRRVEQEAALAANARYQMAAAYLALTGNTVGGAIDIASLRAQAQAIDEILADDQKNLDLVQATYAAGKAARSEALTAQGQLESDRMLGPAVREQLAVARHALPALSGKSPAEWSPPEFELDRFQLPGTLPLSLPSALVHDRPDILAAEAQLHAASAGIGVAQSQLFPSSTLSGSLAAQAASPGEAPGWSRDR